MRRGGEAADFDEAGEGVEKEAQLLDDAGGAGGAEDAAVGGGEGELDGATAALSGADAEAGGFGDDGGVGGIAGEAGGEGAVDAAELFIDDGFEGEVALQAEAEFGEGFDDKEIGGDAGFHIESAAAVEAAVEEIGAEGRMGPGLRAGGDGVDVTAEEEGAATALAATRRAEIRAALVVAAGPVEGMVGDAGEFGGGVEGGVPAGALETGGEVLLAGEFGAEGGAVLRREPHEIGEEGGELPAAGIHEPGEAAGGDGVHRNFASSPLGEEEGAVGDGLHRVTRQWTAERSITTRISRMPEVTAWSVCCFLRFSILC